MLILGGLVDLLDPQLPAHLEGARRKRWDLEYKEILFGSQYAKLESWSKTHPFISQEYKKTFSPPLLVKEWGNSIQAALALRGGEPGWGRGETESSAAVTLLGEDSGEDRVWIQGEHLTETP